MKLQQTKDYLLLIDEEAETCEYYLHMSIDGRHQIYSYKENESNFEKGQQIKWCSKIVAYYPLTKEAKELDLPLLPNPFEKVDVEKLAQEYTMSIFGELDDFIDITEGFKAGYKAAQAKQFSLEGVKKAIEMAQQESWDEGGHLGLEYEPEQIIQSLFTQQLPKEFIPEYNFDCCKRYVDCKGCDATKEMINYRLKIITNSEGKEELVGTYH